MSTIKKEVLPPVPSTATYIIQLIVFMGLMFGTVRGGIALMDHFMPHGVPRAEAPTITLSARKDNCVGRENELWDYSTQRWSCFTALEYTLSDIKRSSGINTLTNSAMYLSASGSQNDYALITSGNIQMGSSNDIVTINGRLIVNGVDITPKKGKK